MEFLKREYYDFLSSGGSNLDDVNTRTRGMYDQTYRTILLAGVFALVISILLTCLTMYFGKSKEKAEGKSNITSTAMAGIVLFAFAGLMQIIIGIVLGLKF